MSRYYDGWAPYVPVAERRRQAERAVEKMRKQGHPVAPVKIEGRAITKTFWGKAWCENLEGYNDYENRLPRGRTYVRNGSVVDLQIGPRSVKALVSGSSLYTVTVSIEPVAAPHWRSICTDCAGGIDSLVELLQGRFSQGVMQRICRQAGGLFPTPKDIRFSCSCPDYATLCKHAAAVLYGIGARLDQQPELLFRLRAVNEKDLIASIDTSMPIGKTGPGAGKVLETDDVSALFGIEMAGEATIDEKLPEAPKPRAPKAAAKPKIPAANPRTSQSTRRADPPATPVRVPKAGKPPPVKWRALSPAGRQTKKA